MGLSRKFVRLFQVAFGSVVLITLYITLNGGNLGAESSATAYKGYMGETHGGLHGVPEVPHGGNSGSGSGPVKGGHVGSKASPNVAPQPSKDIIEHLGRVFRLLEDFKPEGKSERVYGSQCRIVGGIGFRDGEQEGWEPLTAHELDKCLELSDKEVEMLKESHAGFVQKIKQLSLPKSALQGDGIVMVGGGKYSMLALIALKSLRNRGTTLPVEVFIPYDEPEPEFCNNLIPQLNARCISVTDVLPTSVVKDFQFAGYQYKSLAIISSSFRNILLLDADNYALKNLDGIFDEEPFRSTGLVLWPDFWRRTTSPKYYKIAGLEVNQSKRIRNCLDDITPSEVYTDPAKLSQVPLHDFEGTIPDPSTESGQLILDKRRHWLTVLLSLYYNVNGNSWYYPIFSQKVAGEGDKETFIAAAHFFNLPYYQVKAVPGVDGYFRSTGDKSFRGVAVLQHDFVEDYKRYLSVHGEVRSEYKGKKKPRKFDASYSFANFYKKYFHESGDQDSVPVMFAHCNLPKFDPYSQWTGNDYIEDGNQIRSFRNLKKLNGIDMELDNTAIIRKYLCSTEDGKRDNDGLIYEQRSKYFVYLKKLVTKEKWPEMCSYINARFDYLWKTHDEAVRQ